jgi:hypothetical protein
MTSPDDRERALAASAALADIEEQQLYVTQRLGGFTWLHPVVAVVLALAAASLAFRNDALFVVVQAVYLAAVIPLLGVPVGRGVIPREGRQSRRPVAALCFLLVFVPPLAMLGPWWTAIVAGACAGVAVVVLSRWRLAATLREARSLAHVDENPRYAAVTDRVVAVPEMVVIAVICAGALTAESPHRGIASAGLLAYFLGIGSLFVRQHRIGVLPPELSVGLVRKALFFGFLLIAPVLGTMIFTGLRGNWWVAGGCALVVAVSAAIVLRWQRHLLSKQARAAGPPPVDGANG